MDNKRQPARSPRQPDSETRFVHAAVRRFWEDAQREQSFAGWRRVVVGVSGGADSMALLFLAACTHERPESAPDVIAGHVNHGLRGDESDRDEEAARRLATSLGAPFRVRRLRDENLWHGPGLEERARGARLAALRDIARNCGAEGVALAHHAGDLAETLLMRLLRGSGLTGLAGFRPRETVRGLAIVRPLIDWTPEELREVLRRAGISWREDTTNSDRAFLRNRLRHDVLPALESASDHGPVAPTLARTARRLAREGAALAAWCARLYDRHRLEHSAPRRLGLDGEAFRGDAGLFAAHLLRLLVMEAARSAYPPDEERTLELEAFARDAPAQALVQGPSSLVAWKAADGSVWLLRKTRRRMSREELLRLFRKP